MNLAAEIASLRPLLLRYAHLQLRDDAAAEDAVQETMLAALAAPGNFQGRSALQTWLTSILRHKIIDHIRRAARQPSIPLPEVDEGEGDERDFAPLFVADGHWEHAPTDWGNPEKTFENQRFHDVFEACTALLPAQTARVFLMREMLGLETAEICQELAISTSNCWVVLYRARMRLRECLQKNWFGGQAHELS